MTRIFSIAMLCSIILLQGCGDPVANVNGSVTMDSKSLALQPGRAMKVSLRPADPAIESAMTPQQKSRLIASVSKNGAFQFSDIALGEYRVIASYFDSFPSVDRLAEHFEQSSDATPWLLIEDGQDLEVPIQTEWLSKPRRR